MADKDDDLHDAVQAMADRLGLKGRERSKYVHESMTRGGYKAVPTYVPNTDDDDDDDDDGGFFGGRRNRSRGDDSGRSRRRSGGDDWYSG